MQFHQALENFKGKFLASAENSYSEFELLLKHEQPQVMRYQPQRSRQSSFGLKHFSNQYG
jgi:hypothetical protein